MFLRQSQHGDPVKDDDGKDVEMPYGAALYAQLFNMSLSEVGNSFQGPDSEANFFKIMEIVFGDLYDKITGGQPSDIPEDVFKELQKILEIDRDIFIVDQLCQLEEYLNFSMLTADLVSSIVKYGAATNVVRQDYILCHVRDDWCLFQFSLYTVGQPDGC